MIGFQNSAGFRISSVGIRTACDVDPAAPSFGEENRETVCACVFVLYFLAGNNNDYILNDRCRRRTKLQRAATKLEVARMESKRNHPRHAAVSNVTSSIIRSATSDFGIN